MKTIYLREIRHIVANHSLSNKSTGYCFKSKSIIFKIIRDLIKHKLIEPNNIEGQFLFVRPSEELLKVFGTVKMENKAPTIPVLNTKYLWNKRTHDSSFNAPAIIAS
jgi:hypothetical protein